MRGGEAFPFHGRPRTKLGRRQTSSMKERTEAPMKKPNQPPTEAEKGTRTNKFIIIYCAIDLFCPKSILTLKNCGLISAFGQMFFEIDSAIDFVLQSCLGLPT